MSLHEPEALPVPPELAPYFEAAAGPTEAEIRNFWISPPKVALVRPIGVPRPPNEPPDGLVDQPFAEWAHERRLCHAKALWDKDRMAEATAAGLFDCGLCEEETWIAQSSQLDLDDGQTVRLCHGCYPLVRNEQWRRRHAAKLDELLSTGGTRPTS